MNESSLKQLKSGGVGFIMGIAATLGGGAILGGNNQQEVGGSTIQIEQKVAEQPYRGLRNVPDGDVVVTKTGKCYHSVFGCSSLRRAKLPIRVYREDAIDVGLTACTKCLP
ncbi:MAG: hypothetical protein KBT15_09545 [Bacteroidales bacterium]|nr:hypothetical protein [Candidatus Minthousia equi]